MSAKRSFWCSSFSGFWWWLMALLLLPLLLFLMNHFKQSEIENDLSTRVSAALAAEGVDWAEVDLERRGRDVLLRGDADSDEERDRALQIAQGVDGVYKAEYAGDADQAALGLTEDEGDVATASEDAESSGEVADTGDGDTAQGDDQDKTDNNATDTDTDNTTDTNTSSEQNSTAEGTDTESSGDSSTAETAEASLPASLSLSRLGDELILEGSMNTEQADALVNAAQQQVGADNVVNRLQVGDQYEAADWLAGVGNVAGLLGDKGQATVNVKAMELELTGVVESAAAQQALLKRGAEALQNSGLKLVDKLNVVNPEPDVNQAEVCQQRLDTAMQGEKILFLFNKVNISSDSFTLLNELAEIISECSDSMKGQQVLIGGHTDSLGSDTYNQALSQRRADSVRDYLTDKGIKAALLATKGFGESQPIADNNTEQGQAQNRRITFEIKQQ